MKLYRGGWIRKDYDKEMERLTNRERETKSKETEAETNTETQTEKEEKAGGIDKVFLIYLKEWCNWIMLIP